MSIDLADIGPDIWSMPQGQQEIAHQQHLKNADRSWWGTFRKMQPLKDRWRLQRNKIVFALKSTESIYWKLNNIFSLKHWSNYAYISALHEEGKTYFTAPLSVETCIFQSEIFCTFSTDDGMVFTLCYNRPFSATIIQQKVLGLHLAFFSDVFKTPSSLARGG